MYTNKIICAHSRRHPNDIILPVLLPHINFNRDMMLAKDNTPRHVARNTQVIFVTNKRWTLQWPAQSMDLNPSKHTWDILKCNVRVHYSRCNPISGSSRVLLIRCAILQQFLHRYIISWGTMYIAVIDTAGGHTMY